MYAGGDLMLEVFIGGMLLVVTFFLVLVIYKSEPAYTIYSKVVLGLSLTAPLSVGLISIPAVNQGMNVLGEVCMFRLFASPLVIAGMGMSRLFARYPRVQAADALRVLIEGLTLAACWRSYFAHAFPSRLSIVGCFVTEVGEFARIASLEYWSRFRSLPQQIRALVTDFGSTRLCFLTKRRSGELAYSMVWDCALCL